MLGPDYVKGDSVDFSETYLGKDSDCVYLKFQTPLDFSKVVPPLIPGTSSVLGPRSPVSDKVCRVDKDHQSLLKGRS